MNIQKIMQGVTMAKQKINQFKPRNPFIVAAFKNEIDLKTQVVRDRTKYSRKAKHKKDY